MFAMDVFEPARNEVASPIVFVPRKDRIFCVGIDYRKLTAMRIWDS